MEVLKKIPAERRSFSRLWDNIFISYGVRSRVFKAITQNISGSGLMFETDRKVTVGSGLDIDIYQPSNYFKTLIFIIPVKTKVIWRERIKYGFLETGENKYRVGVNFEDIKDHDRSKITKYVDEINPLKE
jgi:hypothetical protein